MTEYYNVTRCYYPIGEIFQGKIPENRCKEVLMSVVNTELNYPDVDLNLQVWLLFLGAIVFLGILIVEFVNSKTLDNTFDPIVKRVTKRYNFVIERNRLLSMNGHP